MKFVKEKWPLGAAVLVIALLGGCGGAGGPTTAQPAHTPTFSPAPTTYTFTQGVTISCGSSGATIYYTIDGSTPDPTTSTVYAAGTPVPVPTTTTIMAVATAPGMDTSAVASGVYTIAPPSAVYSQAPAASGSEIESACIDPAVNPAGAGTSSEFAYDNFTVTGTHTIHEIRWRGGYKSGASHVPATSFWVNFYADNGSNEPDADNPHQLVPVSVWGTEPNETKSLFVATATVAEATETPTTQFDTLATYDYKLALPSPYFSPTSGVKYWVRIEAVESTPDWCVVPSTAGDLYYYWNRVSGTFQGVSGSDLAFSLLE